MPDNTLIPDVSPQQPVPVAGPAPAERLDAAQQPLTNIAEENVDQGVFLSPTPEGAPTPEKVGAAKDIRKAGDVATLNSSDAQLNTGPPVEGLIETPTIADVSIPGVNIRRAGAAHTENLQDIQGTSDFSLMQSRPLSKRRTVNDMYDIKYTDVGGGKLSVDVQAYGGVSRKGLQGDTTKRNAVVQKKKMAAAADSLIAYTTSYANLDSRGKAVGTFQTFWDVVDPFFGPDERPSFSMGGNNVDAIGLGQEMADTFNLFSNWNNISDFNKYKQTANQLIDTATVLGYGDRIPAELTQSMGMLNFGYSAYQLINNWDKMNDAQRIYGALNTINSGATAIEGGATLFNSATGTVAAEGVGTAAGEFSASYAPYLSYAAAAYGAYNTVDQWGEGGHQGRMNGLANGASIGSIWGPVGMAVGAMVGAAIGSINTGKSVAQSYRDSFRDHYQANGLFEKIEGSHQVQLADGSFYDVGIDGGGIAVAGGKDKTVWDTSKIPESRKGDWRGDGKVRPYDIDYTNDLDFATSMATQGLNIMMNGGSNFKNKFGRQMNGYLTNGATSNLSSREFTEENFGAAMANVRAFYGKVGIENMEQALGYLDDMRKQKRISTDDYNSARIGIEYAFGSGYSKAREVNSELGRDREGAPSGEDIRRSEASKRVDRNTLEQDVSEQERIELVDKELMIMAQEEEDARKKQLQARKDVLSGNAGGIFNG